MIVSFSGMDGAGKTTQISLLKESLEARGFKPEIIWSRGGYTPGFELLKKIARKIFKKSLPPPGQSNQRGKIISRPFVSYIWLCLAMLDLIFLYALQLRVLSFLGKIIICDRYLDDTRLDFNLNYESVKFQKMWLWRILGILSPKPDVSFLILLPVEVSMARSIAKSEPFPDDKETLVKRLHSYTNETNFSDDQYISLDGGESIETNEMKVRFEVFTLLGILKA